MARGDESIKSKVEHSKLRESALNRFFIRTEAQFPRSEAEIALCRNGLPIKVRIMPRSPVVLIIRDGWGVNPGGRETAEKDGNATLLARTPFHDEMLKEYPKGMVSCSGMDVGLPEGQMGNSEVGHLNLGAGRIVYQDLTRINKAVEDGQLGENEVLREAFSKAK